MTVLTIDVGNTHTVVGIFRGGQLRARRRLATDVQRREAEWERVFREVGVEEGAGSVLCSVVPRGDQRLLNVMERATGRAPLVVGQHLDTGIRISIPHPATLGADRLANAAYGFHRFGGPLLLIDLGTATTLCAISKEGDYLGGAILPGLMLSLNALSAGTAQLPSISPGGTIPEIGRTTEAAMRLGAIEGHRGAVDRVARKMGVALGGKAVVVATGGLASTVARGLTTIGQVVPDLTLKALNYLYTRNT